jgi:hypothetical protein
MPLLSKTQTYVAGIIYFEGLAELEAAESTGIEEMLSPILVLVKPPH